MSTRRYPFPFAGGINRAKISFRSDPGTFFDMLNFRHVVDKFGSVEQTPYFCSLLQYPQGTYYAAGSQTEPSASAVRLAMLSLVMTDYVMYPGLDSSAQLQVFYQSVNTAAATIYTGCLMVINSVTGLNITLGSTVDVEMTGAAAFRWRKNGGAWTADVPLISGVSIDGGNATLYFLAETGFAGTETWTWTRTDCSFEDSTLVNTRAAQYTFFRDRLLFTNTQDRIMTLKASSTGNVVVSAGYRPVYGTYLCCFENHLFLAGYSSSAVLATSYPRNRSWGCSDLNNVENFVATSTNEADSAILPSAPMFDIISTSNATDFIIGIAEIRKQLFICTTQEIYQTPYFGLPIPFNFTKFADFPLVEGAQTVVRSSTGIYLVGLSLIVFFDGSELRPVSLPIWSLTGQVALGAFYVGSAVVGTASTGVESSIAFYDAVRKEYGFLREKVLYVFQETNQVWYRRSMDFNDSPIPSTCLGLDASGAIIVGVKDRTLLVEAIDWDAQPIYDLTDGTLYTTPKLTTHVYAGQNLASMKEINSMYLAARVGSADSTYFSTLTDLLFNVYWYDAPTGDIVAAAATDALATWNTSAADGQIGLPRLAFRGLALEVQLAGNVSGRPPGQAIITAIEPQIYDLQTVSAESTR